MPAPPPIPISRRRLIAAGGVAAAAALAAPQTLFAEEDALVQTAFREAATAKPGAATDAEWGNGFMTAAMYLAWVYQGV
jgi:hypothetical protein